MQISRFRAAASITGAIWALKGEPDLPGNVVLEGETRDQRLTITRRRARRGAPRHRTKETGPWHEDGQVWHRLLATYPDTIVAHTRQQTYYFDDAGLLRRLDHSVDILGGGRAVQYPSEYREFDGIMVPTRRHVYVRNPDGSPVHHPVSIAIDVTSVTFT